MGNVTTDNFSDIPSNVDPLLRSIITWVTFIFLVLVILIIRIPNFADENKMNLRQARQAISLLLEIYSAGIDSSELSSSIDVDSLRNDLKSSLQKLTRFSVPEIKYPGNQTALLMAGRIQGNILRQESIVSYIIVAYYILIGFISSLTLLLVLSIAIESLTQANKIDYIKTKIKKIWSNFSTFGILLGILIVLYFSINFVDYLHTRDTLNEDVKYGYIMISLISK